jgi:hypothetical protein
MVRPPVRYYASGGPHRIMFRIMYAPAYRNSPA